MSAPDINRSVLIPFPVLLDTVTFSIKFVCLEISQELLGVGRGIGSSSRHGTFGENGGRDFAEVVRDEIISVSDE